MYLNILKNKQKYNFNIQFFDKYVLILSVTKYLQVDPYICIRKFKTQLNKQRVTLWDYKM